MEAIILAAGMGKRLGNSIPKPLTLLAGKKTIMDYQVENLESKTNIEKITAVVGYKKEMITERFPRLSFVYNENFAKTNTSKSLLLALKQVKDNDVIWLNGDVYFDTEILDLLINPVCSCCLVDKKRCGPEEVKYDLNEEGFIHHISKTVEMPKGECLGINIIMKKDLDIFRSELEKVDNQDYFEKALENLTVSGKLLLKPRDNNSLYCHEIDFEEDLKAVNDYVINRRAEVK